MNPVAKLNIALSAALGIQDSGRCSEVTLKIVAGQLPKVQATFWVESAEGLAQLTQCYELRPLPELSTDAAPRIPQAQAEAAEASHAG
jgi:hypothetical protein